MKTKKKKIKHVDVEESSKLNVSLIVIVSAGICIFACACYSLIMK